LIDCTARAYEAYLDETVISLIGTIAYFYVRGNQAKIVLLFSRAYFKKKRRKKIRAQSRIPFIRILPFGSLLQIFTETAG